MAKTKFLGTVGSGNTAAQAGSTFARLLKGVGSNKLMTFAGAADVTYSLMMNVKANHHAFNPFSGRVNLTENAVSRTTLSSMGLPKQLNDKLELNMTKCTMCASYQVSDNPHLVKHCIICGSPMDEPVDEEQMVDVGETGIDGEQDVDDAEYSDMKRRHCNMDDSCESDDSDSEDDSEYVDDTEYDEQDVSDGLTEDEEVASDMRRCSNIRGPLAYREGSSDIRGPLSIKNSESTIKGPFGSDMEDEEECADCGDESVIAVEAGNRAEFKLIKHLVAKACTGRKVRKEFMRNRFVITGSKTLLAEIQEELEEGYTDATDQEADVVDQQDMVDAPSVAQDDDMSSYDEPTEEEFSDMEDDIDIDGQQDVAQEPSDTDIGKLDIDTNGQQEEDLVNDVCASYSKLIKKTVSKNHVLISGAKNVLLKIQKEIVAKSGVGKITIVPEHASDLKNVQRMLSTYSSKIKSVVNVRNGAKFDIYADDEVLQQMQQELGSEDDSTYMQDAPVEPVVEDTETPVDVDLMEEGLDQEATMATAEVDLVFRASDSMNGSRWYAFVNGNPTAYATHAMVGNNAEIFHTERFKIAASAVLSQSTIYRGLKDMGFTGIKVSMPIGNLLATKIERAKQEALVSASNQLESFKSNIESALATAAIGINKGFFKGYANPVKAKLYTMFSAAGVSNAEQIIDEAFSEASDDYNRMLLQKSAELQAMPVAAFNEVSTAVSNATYQRASSSSVSSVIASHLSKSNVMPTRDVAQNVSTSSDDMMLSEMQRIIKTLNS